MLHRLFGFSNDSAAAARRSVIGMYVALVTFNLLAWAWAFVAFRSDPVLLGTALLAYTFGLRHAVDADHIAAIDNVTRKMLHANRNPLGAGLFFSLGHSSVVMAMSVAVASAAATLTAHVEQLKTIGGLVSTSVSAFFLLLLAAVNTTILVSVWRAFRAVQRGEPLAEDDLDLLAGSRGFLARLFRPLFGLASRSWHLYPIGILFGLGFDTATEVALFGISATQASGGLSIGSIIALPLLFTAGMSLVDTTDGILMTGAYRWAFTRPIRKLYYNLTITLVSVAVAAVIGTVEVLALAASRFQLSGPFWRCIGGVAEHFGVLGYFIIGIFVLGWGASVFIYRMKRYDEIDVTISSPPNV